MVRPPGPLIGLIPIYGGVTASGAGKAQLVLDLGTLADIAYSAAALPPAAARRGQPRVLVVDDSRLAREAAARLLGASGYQTVPAEDGWEAWEMLGERRFDAVVTALEMPRLDGFELIASRPPRAHAARFANRRPVLAHLPGGAGAGHQRRRQRLSAQEPPSPQHGRRGRRLPARAGGRRRRRQWPAAILLG